MSFKLGFNTTESPSHSFALLHTLHAFESSLWASALKCNTSTKLTEYWDMLVCQTCIHIFKHECRHPHSSHYDLVIVHVYIGFLNLQVHSNIWVNLNMRQGDKKTVKPFLLQIMFTFYQFALANMFKRNAVKLTLTNNILVQSRGVENTLPHHKVL